MSETPLGASIVVNADHSVTVSEDKCWSPHTHSDISPAWAETSST